MYVFKERVIKGKYKYLIVVPILVPILMQVVNGSST